jgi:hypothetical protein
VLRSRRSIRRHRGWPQTTPASSRADGMTHAHVAMRADHHGLKSAPSKNTVVALHRHQERVAQFTNIGSKK